MKLILDWDDKDKEKVARFLHNSYEDLAKEVGWKTQDSCQVEFENLPPKNKLVMEKLTLRLLNFINEQIEFMK